MTVFATLFLFATSLALIVVPRRWAPLPLIVGACYISRGEGVDIASLNFTVLRMLVAVGLFRIFVRREWLHGRMNAIDHVMIAWGVWMLGSVYFHNNAAIQIANRSRLVFEGWGLYYLLRVFCSSIYDARLLFTVLAILLLPIAAAMSIEILAFRNLFAVFGDVPQTPVIRNGLVRAQGPFAHPILAGNIGAVCLPLMIGLWQFRRNISVVGAGACLVMVYASASSGPVISAVAGLAALLCWPYRRHVRVFRWAVIVTYAALELVMRAPAYYLIARIDLTGGSASWHRARLIQSAFSHLSEWWLTGTDYTRHWMPSGVTWSVEHTDITNHYIRMGVFGGVLLMLLFIGTVYTGFSLVGSHLRRASRDTSFDFLIWASGASLFAHAVTCLSVSYFDQTITFFYLTLAAIAAEGTASVIQHRPAPVSQQPRRFRTRQLRLRRFVHRLPVTGGTAR